MEKEKGAKETPISTESLTDFNGKDNKNLIGIKGSFTTIPEESIKNIEYLSLLKSARISPDIELPPPPVAIELIQDQGSIPICTLGNFSLIIGKAKTKKTFFLTMAMAATVSNEYSIFRGCLPKDQNKVIYFDTEQSHYHALKTVKRVCRMAGYDLPSNFEAYGLRKFNPSERMELIRVAIETIEGIGLVVIDGIRDVVTSINDEEQATTTASNLLKWTEEKNIHIITVLHQNKGDNNARGHLGSELTNKAETTISISKSVDDDELSIVEADSTRGIPFNPFAFRIEDDVPILADGWEPTGSKKAMSKTVEPTEVPISTHYECLVNVFNGSHQMTYSELLNKVKIELARYSLRLGENKLRSYINYYKECSLITESGTPGTKAMKYQLNENYNEKHF